MKKTHVGLLNEKDKDKKVKVQGWVDTIREHGKLIFLDIRDITGILQAVISIKENPEFFEVAKKLTKESCVELEGTIELRPKGTINENISTGKIEMKIEKLEIFNLCPPVPFELDNKSTNEEIRLKRINVFRRGNS